MSAAIAKRFFDEIDLTAVRTLHTFIRIPKLNEIYTSAIYFRIWRDWPSILTLAPRMASEGGELESVDFDASTKLIANPWGIPEPAGEALADAGLIDLVIVPLLCFDEFGNRVGYGKGYYDRFLARCRPDCRKIGISLFPPETQIDGINDTDMAIDACITPDQSYHFSPGRSHHN